MKILCKVFFFFSLEIRYSPHIKSMGWEVLTITHEPEISSFFFCVTFVHIYVLTLNSTTTIFIPRNFHWCVVSTTSYLGLTFCRLVHFFLNKCLLVSCLISKANSNIMNGFSTAIPYSWFRNLLFFKSIFLLDGRNKKSLIE